MQLMSSAAMVPWLLCMICVFKGQSFKILTTILSSRAYYVLCVLQTAGNYWKQLLGSFLQ